MNLGEDTIKPVRGADHPLNNLVQGVAQGLTQAHWCMEFLYPLPLENQSALFPTLVSLPVSIKA